MFFPPSRIDDVIDSVVSPLGKAKARVPNNLSFPSKKKAIVEFSKSRIFNLKIF